MKNKLLLLSAVMLISGICAANANLALTDINAPKSPAYRVGISEIPERPYVQTVSEKDATIKQAIQKQTNPTENDVASYGDLSIKKISQEISYDLECEEQEMVSDLSLLWQGAAMQSDTINFALYKLANPDADKPNKSTVKNMLKTVASMSTLVGAGMANPLLAGTSLIGANVLGIMSQDTKALNYKYSKVTDADMIILIRKVEDLQQKTVDLYYDYMTAKKQFDMTTKLAQERKKRFEQAQKNNVAREIIVITDSHFRTAMDKQKTARSVFLSKRAALEQFVGNEAFNQFEQELMQRENSLNGASSEVKEEYTKTVSGVENYTNNLSSKTASLSGIGYIEEEEDKNLSKLDEIKALTPEAPAEPEVQVPQETQPEQSEQKTNKLKDKIKAAKNKKIKKDNKKEKTKEEKPKKVKRDPYDTKGFIFLHDKQPDASNYQDTTNNVKETTQKTKKHKDKKSKEISQNAENTKAGEIKPVEAQKTNKYHGVELMPLDDIKAPDLKPHGYSIFEK